MRENISPEEKLLRLIKNQKKQKAASDTSVINASLTAPKSPDESAVKTKQEQSLSAALNKYLSFKYFKIGIYIVFSISSVLLISVFISPFLGFNKAQLPEVTQMDSGKIKTDFKPLLQPYDFYLDGIGSRQIFTAPATSSSKTKVKSADKDVLIKDMILLGIIAGDEPQVIIENKKTHKTYYLNKGEFIENFEVKDIQDGKVILDYNGEKSELYL